MAQFGRALRSGRRGRRFKSCRIDYLEEVLESLEIKGFRLFYFSSHPILYFLLETVCRCIYGNININYSENNGEFVYTAEQYNMFNIYDEYIITK